ncbi:hypothetical protein B7486_07600 [cyanobacterium TDX16]|nr:hypothetical protein B7486_07600 [cyanobacterium TDX16]
MQHSIAPTGDNHIAPRHDVHLRGDRHPAQVRQSDAGTAYQKFATFAPCFKLNRLETPRSMRTKPPASAADSAQNPQPNLPPTPAV